MKCALVYTLSLLLCSAAFGSRMLGAETAGGAFAGPRVPDDKPRVFITDSKSWSVSGGFGGSSAGFAGATAGGARPQTVEIIKTFGQKCPGVIVTMKQERAAFVVLLDHEGGKGWLRKDNKVAVFNSEGDAILSKSTRTLGNSVSDACKAIMNSPLPASEPLQPPQRRGPTSKPEARPASQPVSKAGRSENTTVLVTANLTGADITVNGKYMGSTPSTLRLPPGDHTISIELSGFKTWQRTMTVTAGGNVTVNARLEKTH